MNRDTSKTEGFRVQRNPLTPAPGFEPGYPFGNEGSSLAQYQIVPRRHTDFICILAETRVRACRNTRLCDVGIKKKCSDRDFHQYFAPFKLEWYQTCFDTTNFLVKLFAGAKRLDLNPSHRLERAI